MVTRQNVVDVVDGERASNVHSVGNGTGIRTIKDTGIFPVSVHMRLREAVFGSIVSTIKTVLRIHCLTLCVLIRGDAGELQALWHANVHAGHGVDAIKNWLSVLHRHSGVVAALDNALSRPLPRKSAV